MTVASEEVYGRAILAQIPRVIGRMDRETYSPTAGCCDRTFWAWKFTDFPGARFQEAVCVLSFVYATDFPGNIYFRKTRLLDWIQMALRYWSSIQYRDGSFDEAYPNERSLAATAFTTFYVGEALQFLRGELDDDTAKAAQSAMRRAGDWLAGNDETHGFLSNHLAAAAAALHHVYILTSDNRFRERSDHFLQRILRHQSQEGWYEEYGGADFGYQTHGCFYLARLLELAPQQPLQESLKRAVGFQAAFIHPDRSLGGEYASRNTQTYYPAAFEMLAGRDSAAAWIALRMRPVVEGSAAAGMRAVDAYNLFPLLNNLVFAFTASRNTPPDLAEPAEPESCRSWLWYPKAGIARYKRAGYVAYVGTSKGGVMKVFDRRTCRLVYSDCGYVGRRIDDQIIASQHFDPLRPAAASEDALSLKTSFVKVSRPIMSPALFIGFRAFSMTLGRSPAFARWLKKWLVRLLIYRKSEIGIELERTIQFSDESITVRDRLQGTGGSGIKQLEWGPSFTTIHMGSSRYFVDHELNDIEDRSQPRQSIDVSRLNAGIELERTIRFD